MALADMLRSYHPEISRTHQNTELKPDWASLVLTWVTSGESLVTQCFLSYVGVNWKLCSELKQECNQHERSVVLLQWILRQQGCTHQGKGVKTNSGSGITISSSTS